MNTIFTTTYHSPVGELLLGSFDDMLCLCDWTHRNARAVIDKRICKELDAKYLNTPSDVTITTQKELDEYFAGTRTTFTVPTLTAGSDFQKYVWEALKEIQYGICITYADVARIVGNPEAIRAISAAIGANALSIVIPCHRVIGSNGKLTGYAGGVETKKKLLLHEGCYSVGKIPFSKQQ